MDSTVVGVVDVGHDRLAPRAGGKAQPLRIFEMNSATIRSVSQVSHIGLGLPRDEDCRVPAGATVMEYKTCENCGRSFTRPRIALQAVVLQNPDDHFGAWGQEPDTKTIYKDVGIKFCNECHQRYLMPVDEEVYRETLPKITHHPQRLIHFDDSLLPKKKKVVVRVRIPLTSRKQLGDWKMRLKKEIAERGPLSMVEMLEITHHKNYSTLKINLIRAGSQAVACVWPRNKSGAPAKLFIL